MSFILKFNMHACISYVWEFLPPLYGISAQQQALSGAYSTGSEILIYGYYHTQTQVHAYWSSRHTASLAYTYIIIYTRYCRTTLPMYQIYFYPCAHSAFECVHGCSIYHIFIACIHLFGRLTWQAKIWDKFKNKIERGISPHTNMLFSQLGWAAVSADDDIYIQ